MNDPRNGNGLQWIGEIGGLPEADAAHWIKADGTVSQLYSLSPELLLQVVPSGACRCTVGGSDDTAEAKKKSWHVGFT
jgi:succinyl-CoA synthetase alpha subunit